MNLKQIVLSLVFLAVTATGSLCAQTAAKVISTGIPAADVPDANRTNTDPGLQPAPAAPVQPGQPVQDDAVPSAPQPQPAPVAREVKPVPIEPSQNVTFGTAEFRSGNIVSELIPIP